MHSQTSNLFRVALGVIKLPRKKKELGHSFPKTKVESLHVASDAYDIETWSLTISLVHELMVVYQAMERSMLRVSL